MTSRANRSSPTGRLAVLLASAAAFLLLPAAGASAAIDTFIEFEGKGSGWVKGERVQKAANRTSNATGTEKQSTSAPPKRVNARPKP